jgi:hypothetical protein
LKNLFEAVREKNPHLYEEIMGEMKPILLHCKDNFIQYLQLNENYENVVPSDEDGAPGPIMINLDSVVDFFK